MRRSEESASSDEEGEKVVDEGMSRSVWRSLSRYFERALDVEGAVEAGRSTAENS